MIPYLIPFFSHAAAWCVIQEEEVLSALTGMMQEPGSPEVKKPPVIEDDSKEYTQLVSYSIVIDIKSTVWAQEGLWLHIQLYIVHKLEKKCTGLL